ncbi:MAG: cytochrome b [Bdellovibrionaceae bacterium]|nr:cytochrome b [Pseudobdellovibrionaceae bacterium]|tara:strand:- start:5174 stop:5953 length:780 start_codon:yes stop_codon:yes gene_type:complete
MKTSKAYDLPLRIFHWTFAILFVLSFSIGNYIDDDSVLHAYHMLSGILMTFIVILRLFWARLGSKTSRINHFRLQPSELISYFKSVFSHDSKRYLGHNPASSYAAIFMILFTLGLFSSGLLMTFKIEKHFFKETHEIFANLFLLLVILHISGVFLHQWKHKDGMIFSMLNGKKEMITDEEEIKSQHGIVAIIFTFLIIGMGSYLVSHFDRNTGILSIYGSELQLWENEDDYEIGRDDDDGISYEYSDDHQHEEENDHEH